MNFYNTLLRLCAAVVFMWVSVSANVIGRFENWADHRYVCGGSDIIGTHHHTQRHHGTVSLPESIGRIVVELDRALHVTQSLLEFYARNRLFTDNYNEIIENTRCAQESLVVDSELVSDNSQLPTSMAADYRILLDSLPIIKLLQQCAGHSDSGIQLIILENSVYDILCDVNKAMRAQDVHMRRRVDVVAADDMCSVHSLASLFYRDFTLLHQLQTLLANLSAKYSDVSSSVTDDTRR